MLKYTQIDMAERRLTANIALCVSLLISTTSGSEATRGRRSDDASPLEVMVSTLSQKVDQLTAHDAVLDAQIAQLTARLAAAETAVAFSAKFGNTDIIHIGQGQTLVYDIILNNLGNGYSKDTGFFTAPSAGTYAFYFNVAQHAGDDGTCTQVDLMHGSTWLLTADACNHFLNTGSNLAVRRLNAGDVVRVQMRAGDKLHGDYHTSFSGWKVSPM